MNQIELIAEKIATRLKTREAAMASNVVSIDNVGNARKTTPSGSAENGAKDKKTTDGSCGTTGERWYSLEK